MIESSQNHNEDGNLKGMALDRVEKEAIIQEYRVDENDKGSPEVQKALLSARITGLTQHIRVHKHDEATRRGLLSLVGKRRRLLQYLNGENVDRYRSLIARLGLRR